MLNYKVLLTHTRVQHVRNKDIIIIILYVFASY